MNLHNKVLLAAGLLSIPALPAMSQTVGPCASDWERPFEVSAGLYPFASNCLAHELGTLHYVDEGPRDAETTVLFVHGNPNWSYMFHDAMLHVLGQGARVVSLDQFGFGYSDSLPPEVFGYTPREQSDVLEQLVEALDLQDITLVVHDWGGPIGLGFAGRNPERINHLVINNTTGFLLDINTETYMSRTHRWGLLASAGRDQLISNCVIPNSASHAEAFAYDPTEGDLYAEVFAATAGSFFTADGALRAPWSCGPPVWMAETIATDTAYLDEVEAGLSQLRGTPYTLMYALGDQIFGELHADMRDPQNPSCPGDLVAMCDADILVPGQTCETIRENHLNEGWVCRTPDGESIAPYADRFREILGEDSLVFYETRDHERHWVASHEATRALIRDALDTVLEARP